ncbi:hypothetical protein PI125_g17888 [Phytophthora idaei]|nr:hypothetical protein PI125_g17888 [Phytophthora idaei]
MKAFLLAFLSRTVCKLPAVNLRVTLEPDPSLARGLANGGIRAHVAAVLHDIDDPIGDAVVGGAPLVCGREAAQQYRVLIT